MVTVSLPASPVAVLLSVAEDAVAFALAVAPQAVMDTANAAAIIRLVSFFIVFSSISF